MTTHRLVKTGEILAIDPRSIHRGADGFFLMMAPSIPPTQVENGVACVYIRGPLDHHDEGCGDNYDAILARVEEALANEDVRAVMLSIDSPGGVVSGLNETIARLRAMGAEARKPLVAFVDEMATSAAYALACACDEILLPRSGICGSIGVISTMADQFAYDQKQGFNFVTITSGARKADGHPHVPISDGAITAESRRVDKLAAQFFGIVNEARGLSVKTIQGLQAALFLGVDAVQIGLADGVMSREKALSEMAGTNLLASGGSGGSDFTGVKIDPGPKASTAREPSMAIALAALIKQTKAAMAKEKNAAKRKVLADQLEAYTKTKYKLEEETKEESADEEEEEEASGNETDRDESSAEDGGDDGDDEGDDDEEDEEEEAAAASTSEVSAMTSALRQMTGKRSTQAILGAVNVAFAKAVEFDRISKDVKVLKTKERDRELDALIAEGSRKGQFPNPRFAAALKAQGLKAVKAYLAATRAGTFLSTAEAKHISPDGRVATPALTEKDLEGVPVSAEMQHAAEVAHAANPRVPVEKFVENMRKAEFSRMNGKGTY